MSYTGALIAIDNYEIPKVTGYTVTNDDLYESADRNLNGAFVGSYIGEYPTLEITCTGLFDTELREITSRIKSRPIVVDWYDVESNTVKTTNFYKTKYSKPLINKYTGLYGEFKITFIPINKL